MTADIRTVVRSMINGSGGSVDDALSAGPVIPSQRFGLLYHILGLQKQQENMLNTGGHGK